MTQSLHHPSPCYTVQWPKARQTVTLLSVETLWEPRDHFPVAKGKGQSALWVRLSLHHTLRSSERRFFCFTPFLFGCL